MPVYIFWHQLAASGRNGGEQLIAHALLFGVGAGAGRDSAEVNRAPLSTLRRAGEIGGCFGIVDTLT